MLKDLTQVSKKSKQNEGKALMPQRFRKNTIFIFFQFNFFCQVFYSRSLERGCLLRYSTGDSPAIPHSGHTTGPETSGSRNIPSIGGWIFPRLEYVYSLDWRMDIPSIGVCIFPRLEDGYSLDWRMDSPSIGGWIFPRLEDR